MSQRIVPLNTDRQLQAYVIGLAIGDGNLSNPNGRAVRLRITCDTKYPALIDKVTCSLKRLLPDNRVSIVRNKARCVNVSVYSNHLENLLGWKAKGGSKHRQCIRIPQWICEDPSFAIPCLRGLIETDGCVYKDRGYPMVNFSTIIPELAQQVVSIMLQLGFQPHLYRIPKTSGQLFKYHVRLSYDVPAFLKLVQPLKA